MGWSELFGQLLNTGASWALNQYSGLSKSENEQNAFNANEAQKGRDFSAQQAEVERDWQEEMYAKYNSLQGQINQAKEAGVNPMLAVTGSATSPMSASAGTAAAPTASGSASRGPNIDMVGAALGFSKLKAEIDNINASTRYQNGQALLAEIDSQTRGELNTWNIASVVQSIETSKADEQQKLQAINESASRILLNDADFKVKNEQLAVMGAQIADLNASRGLKVAQTQQVFAAIANTQEDTKLKAAQILYVAAQTRSERAMASVLTENVKLSRQQRKAIEASVKEIYQRFDHNKIMYSFEEMSAQLSLQAQDYDTANTELGHLGKVLWNSLCEVLTLGAYSSVGASFSYGNNVNRSTSTSTSTSNNTTTIIDGNPVPVRNRVGF